MSMSRKDYEAIAAAIRGLDIPLDEYWNPETRTWTDPRLTVAVAIADAIQSARNRTFDRARFLSASTGLAERALDNAGIKSVPDTGPGGVSAGDTVRVKAARFRDRT